MTALKDTQTHDPEVLIEEARRRQRRRRIALQGLLIVGLIAGGLWLTSGGGPPAGQVVVSGGDGSASAPSGSWRELSDRSDGIARGAWVAGVTRYRGELVATGTLCAVSRLASGCDPTYDPVVWVSRTGAKWTKVFQTPAPRSLDYGRERLLVTNGALFLFNPGEPGGGEPQPVTRPALWRTVNLRQWQHTTVPRAAETSLATASRNGVILTGGMRAWSSTTGLSWTPIRTPQHPPLRALLITGTDPRLTAIGIPVDGRPAISAPRLMWHSTNNGSTWSQVALPASATNVIQIGTSRSGVMIGISRPPSTITPEDLYWATPSRDSWHPARILGLPSASGNKLLSPAIYHLASGFVASVSTSRVGRVGRYTRVQTPQMWWSRNGRIWAPLKLTTQLPTGYSAQLTVPIGNTLFVVAQQNAGSGTSTAAHLTTGNTTFWQLKLTPPKAS